MQFRPGMPAPAGGSGLRNEVLAALSPTELDTLRPYLARVRLAPGQVLQEPGSVLDHVFFIEQGLALLLAEEDGDTPASQLSMVGREAGVGLMEVVADSPVGLAMAVVQVGGVAVRAPALAVKRLMDHQAGLRDGTRKAARSLLQQVMQTSASNARDTLLQRCVRWLVMASRRLDGGDVMVTHDMLATLLGVRRSGVTVAMAGLQAQGLIQTGRGRIRVLDATALQALMQRPKRGNGIKPPGLDGGYPPVVDRSEAYGGV